MPNPPAGRDGDAAVSPERVRLRTLGAFSAEVRGEGLDWLLTHKLAAALLLYLAVERETTRDVLLALLWPEQNTEKARHSLSQMLYRLRQHLGDDWVEVHGDRLRASPVIDVDAAGFARAAERHAWAEAVTAYRGPFLAGVYLASGEEFEGWVERQRARLEHLHRRARREYVDERIAAGDRQGALEAARQWVEQYPLEDAAQHRLIALLAEAGNRSDALAQYARYQRLLVAEQLEPLEETRELADRLRAGELASAGEWMGTVPAVAPVREAIIASPPASLEAPDNRGSFRRSWVTSGAVILLASSFSFSSWDREEKPRADAAAVPRESDVAVLHITNLSPGGVDQYLADGLTEDLATLLGRMGRLNVKAPGAVKRAEEAHRGDLPAIARALGVQYLLEASVRRTQDGVRVSARLVERESESQAWSNTYDATPATLLDLPVLVVHDVGDALTGGLSRAEAEAAAERPTRNADAYDAFQRGNYFLSRRTPAGAEAAHAEYARAFQLDPFFVGALARDAHAYVQQVDYSFIPVGETPESLIARAVALIDRALARDSASAEAWTARAYALIHLGRLRGALQAAERAVKLDPGSIEAQNRLGWVLFHLGDYAAAGRQGRNVLALDPGFYIGYRLLGESAFYRGRYSQALAMMDSALRLSPADVASHHWRARIRLASGDASGARADAFQHDRLVDTVTWLPPYVLAKSGEPAPAQRWVAENTSARDAALDADASPGLALLWLALGNQDRAIETLERAVPGRTGPWLYSLSAPEFGPIAQDPRFKAVLRDARTKALAW